MKENKRLKILFLPSWYPSDENPVGGIFVREHAKAVSLYNDVIVLYGKKDKNVRGIYKLISDKEEDDIRTVRFIYKKTVPSKISYVFYLLGVFIMFKRILNDGWKPDIIHAHVYLAGVPAVILGKIYKIPVVITEHWTGFPRHTLTKINVFLARFAMNRANIILPVSNNLRRHIQSYGIHNVFQVIPNVVNMDLFHMHFNEKGTKRMLLVALLDPKKGVKYLLYALAKLRKNRNDFVLDIVGDGPNRKEYEEMVKQLGLEKVVRFRGLKTKPEVAEFMRRCDFFVLPSVWENLPCVLIEAMASGLPIVATKVGGVPEIINEKIGVLVPPKNVDALSEAIDYMLDHYREYSPKKISQYAKNNFSYESVGNKLNNVYRRVLYGR